MTFFTRVNTDVPFLPSEECHSDTGTLKKSDNDGDNAENKESVADGESNDAGRYEYVVDRVLGVEV